MLPRVTVDGQPAAWPGQVPAAVEEALDTLLRMSQFDPDIDGLRRSSQPQRVAPDDAARPPAEGRGLAEARYRTLIEQIPAVTFLASLAGGENEIYVSPQIESLLGFTQQEWVSDPVLWYRQTHPDDRERVSLQFAEACLTGQPFRDVIRVFTRGGEMVWVHAEARLVRDQQGQLLFLQGVGFDVTEQYRGREAREQLIREQAARAEADRERDRLREIFNGLPDAIALLRGPDHVVEFVNPVALELADPGTDVLGRPFAEAFAAFADGLGDALDRVLATGEPYVARELRVADAAGQHERFFGFVCQRLHDDRGPLLLTHAAEVTQQVQARHQVEEALRLRDEFLSIASHELKTPLAALQGHAQLVARRLERNGEVDPQRLQQALKTITGQTTRLARLVGQLLDVSRLEAGKLELERESTDLVPLVEQVVANARATTSRHTITLQAPPSLTVEVDPLRIDQVLTNLLNNAVKYSPDGGPIEVALRSAPAKSAELSVRDYGLGIPPERRGHIFERFYQAHETSHRSGLGLGLYNCRQIVELHGGEIGVEFPPGRGTRFVVRLPTHRA